jgi:hypothetical protein
MFSLPNAIITRMEHSSKQKNEPIGPFFGIVLVVLVLLAGGIYFFLSEQNKLERAEPLEYYDQALRISSGQA